MNTPSLVRSRGVIGRKAKADMYQKEHDALFASIRSGNPINNGDFMTKSALMGIMGAWRPTPASSSPGTRLMKSKEKTCRPVSLRVRLLAGAPRADAR